MILALLATVAGPTAAAEAGLPPLGLSLEAPETLVRDVQAHGGGEQALACRPFAEALSLCFTWQDRESRRFVRKADLARWGLDLPGLEAAVRDRAAASLGQARPERTPVTDMDASYCLSMTGDGLDLAGFLLPERLAELCGPVLRVAVPSRDLLIAWNGAGEELDRVMAIGVARIHEASDQPVTARVYAWDAATASWQVWGIAHR